MNIICVSGKNEHQIPQNLRYNLKLFTYFEEDLEKQKKIQVLFKISDNIDNYFFFFPF